MERLYFNELAIANRMDRAEGSIDLNGKFIAKVMLAKGNKLKTEFKSRAELLKFLKGNAKFIGNKGRVSVELFNNGFSVPYFCNIAETSLHKLPLFVKPNGIFIKLTIQSEDLDGGKAY